MTDGSLESRQNEVVGSPGLHAIKVPWGEASEDQGGNSDSNEEIHQNKLVSSSWETSF